MYAANVERARMPRVRGICMYFKLSTVLQDCSPTDKLHVHVL